MVEINQFSVEKSHLNLCRNNGCDAVSYHRCHDCLGAVQRKYQTFAFRRRRINCVNVSRDAFHKEFMSS